MKKLRILIADSQPLVREGVRALLHAIEDFEVVGEVANSNNLPDSILMHSPDIIIMDYNQPGYFTITDLKDIYEAFPGMKILVVTNSQNQTEILKALDFGVTNFIQKVCEKDEFLMALNATMKKERFFCGQILDTIFDKQFPKSDTCDGRGLSPREIEIVQLISKGLTNNHIAEKLFISAHTVGTHRKNILRKLDLNKSSELIMYAIKNGLVSAG